MSTVHIVIKSGCDYSLHDELHFETDVVGNTFCFVFKGIDDSVEKTKKFWFTKEAWKEIKEAVDINIK